MSEQLVVRGPEASQADIELQPINSGLISVLEYNAKILEGNIKQGHPENLGISLRRYIECNPKAFEDAFVDKIGAVVQRLYMGRDEDIQLSPQQLHDSNTRALGLLGQFVDRPKEEIETFFKYIEGSCPSGDKKIFYADAPGHFWKLGGQAERTSAILNHALARADEAEKPDIDNKFIEALGDSLTINGHRKDELEALLKLLPESTKNTASFAEFIKRVQKLADEHSLYLATGEIDESANIPVYRGPQDRTSQPDTTNGYEDTAAAANIEPGTIFKELTKVYQDKGTITRDMRYALLRPHLASIIPGLAEFHALSSSVPGMINDICLFKHWKEAYISQQLGQKSEAANAAKPLGAVYKNIEDIQNDLRLDFAGGLGETTASGAEQASHTTNHETNLAQTALGFPPRSNEHILQQDIIGPLNNFMTKLNGDLSTTELATFKPTETIRSEATGLPPYHHHRTSFTGHAITIRVAKDIEGGAVYYLDVQTPPNTGHLGSRLERLAAFTGREIAYAHPQ